MEPNPLAATGIHLAEEMITMRRSLLISLLPYFVGVVALCADQAQKRLAPRACVQASLQVR